jgi:hypothetical protein
MPHFCATKFFSLIANRLFSMALPERASGLSKCRLTAYRARVKALSTWLQGLLLLGEASLSGMGRGATLLDEQKTFSGQLK